MSNFYYIYCQGGRRVIEISWSLIWWRPWWNLYLTAVVNFGEVRRAQSNPTSSPPRWCPWDPFRSFKVCPDAKERVGWGNNRKLPHLSIPSKTAAWVTDFAVEDLPLSRTAALIPEFAVKDLPLCRKLDDDDDDHDDDDRWQKPEALIFVPFYEFSSFNSITLEQDQTHMYRPRAGSIPRPSSSNKFKFTSIALEQEQIRIQYDECQCSRIKHAFIALW